MVITLLSSLSPKQKAFIESLKRQGIEYKLVTKDGRTTIIYDSIRDGFCEDDYMITGFDLAIGEWGD